MTQIISILGKGNVRLKSSDFTPIICKFQKNKPEVKGSKRKVKKRKPSHMTLKI